MVIKKTYLSGPVLGRGLNERRSSHFRLNSTFDSVAHALPTKPLWHPHRPSHQSQTCSLFPPVHTLIITAFCRCPCPQRLFSLLSWTVMLPLIILYHSKLGKKNLIKTVISASSKITFHRAQILHFIAAMLIRTSGFADMCNNTIGLNFHNAL